MERFIEALRFLDSKQNVVEDAHGNLSCRTLDGILIKPSGMSYSEIESIDLVETDYTGKVTGRFKSRKPSVDTSQHIEIYSRNERVKSICHTHSPYATAFAIAGKSMDVMCTEHADYFGHKIICLEFDSFDEWGKIVLGNNEQAVLLGKHGTLICSNSNDPMSAVKLAIALESIAKKYVLASSISGLFYPLAGSEIKRWNLRYYNDYGQK